MPPNRWTAPIALAAAAAALALVALPWRGAPVPAARAPSAGGPPVAAPAPSLGPTGASSPAAAGEPGRTAAPAPAAVLRLRCVAWEDGAALPGCELLVDGVALARADGGGAFAIELPPFASAVLELRAEGHVAVARTVEPGARGTDLGDVRMRGGAAVRGVVVDESQRPCEGVRVRCTPEPPATRGDGWTERWAEQAGTGADGAFALPGPLPAGPAQLAVDGGSPLVGPASVRLEPRGEHDLVLVCRDSRASDWIEGAVRDADGVPVAGAIVHVAAPTGGEDGGAGVAIPVGAASARSRGDGTFRLFRGTCTAERVLVAATSVALDRAAAPVGPVAWGARDVVVELPVAPALALRVTCADTNQPIDGLAVQCLRTAGVRPVDVPRRRARSGGGGLVWVDGVAPGPGVLVVWPDDARWLPAGPIAFEHGDGGSAGIVAVALPRAVACPVRVRTASGSAVAGVAVELLVPAGSTIVRDLDRLFAGGGSRGPVDVRVARATTDADGVASLRWFADPRALVLRLHGPGIAPREVGGVRVGPGAVDVTVDDAGCLELALRGAGGARVVLQRGDERLPPPWAGAWVLDAAGEGVFAVPAGTWQWQLQRPLAIDGRAAAAWLAVPAGDAGAAVRVGETVRVERDVAPLLATGEIAGVAFVDGEPAERVVLACGEADGDAVAVRHVAEQVPDARGAFRFTQVPAGAHALQLRLRCGTQQVAVPVAPRVDLAAGERRVLPACAVATAPVVVRVRGGLPSGAMLELFAAPSTALIAAPNADGDVRLPRVPAARYRVRVRGGGGDEPRELGAIDVRAGAATVFELDGR